MTRRTVWTGWASIALGFGIAGNAIAGPLVLNIMRPRVSSASINQLLGGEMVSLLIAAPLAVTAGILLLRAHRIAAVLAMGPSLYAAYTNTQLAIGPQYERYPGNSEYFFLWYLLLVVLGWLVAVACWAQVRDLSLPGVPTALRRTLGVLLLSINALFALAWFASIARVLRGPPTVEYELDQSLFWLVRFMDLGFVIPAGLIVGAGLLRKRMWAIRAAFAFCGVQVLLACAVTGMSAVMTMRDDPAASLPLLLFTATMSAGLIAAYARLLREATVQTAGERQVVTRESALASGFS